MTGSTGRKECLIVRIRIEEQAKKIQGIRNELRSTRSAKRRHDLKRQLKREEAELQTALFYLKRAGK